ncbi:Molybdopterin binding protein [Pyrrhoderma noxium]|uniref:Molybdopterin binding protein n=1 Tax=Pyrrhoderma noxium TaxID=2282107 RepID=A0A286UIE4_9AGAM|nr:Molybdopterin binding protein [Pyrrhoderma noxium]
MFPAHTRLQKLARHLSPGSAASRYRTQQPNNNTTTATTSSVPFRLMATATTSASASRQTRTYGFEVSPATKNPLGEGKWIKTAACLIIGDEILNGKTHDTNSNTFAKFCFEHGISLKRIEVIADDEEEIVEASRRMVQKYDFVITSGGIGPTHDDITYQSLAAAFNQPLVHHSETLRRMAEMSRHRSDIASQTQEQKVARERMALFPANAEVLFVNSELWVPVVRLEGKLCILPGIPGLFQRLLSALTPYLPLPPPSERPFRHLIFTKLPESNIAPYLTDLHKRVSKEGIQVGSYPAFQQGVTVSLIGRNEARVREIGDEVARGIQGEVIEASRIGEESAPIPQ